MVDIKCFVTMSGVTINSVFLHHYVWKSGTDDENRHDGGE